MAESTSLIVRGVIGVLLGIAALIWPGITLAALVVLFGVFAFFDGIVSLVAGLTRDPVQGRSWGLAILGIVGIGVAVLAFMMPGVTLIVLISFIAAWAIVRGVIEIAAAIRLRRVITGEWLLGLAGLLSILFGIAVIAFPFAGALAIAWLLGAYAFAAGIVLIAAGVRLQRVRV